MADKGFKRFIPTFIPLFLELLRHLKRDSNHNNNIKKFDKTQEKLSSVEHLLVRLEKKVIQQRDDISQKTYHIKLWLAVNSALLIAIVIKLFFLN